MYNYNYHTSIQSFERFRIMIILKLNRMSRKLTEGLQNGKGKPFCYSGTKIVCLNVTCSFLSAEFPHLPCLLYS